MPYPYKEAPYNENLSPALTRAGGIEYRMALSREAGTVKASKSSDGYPPIADGSLASIQIYLRLAPGGQNRAGVPGAGPGLLEGDRY